MRGSWEVDWISRQIGRLGRQKDKADETDKESRLSSLLKVPIFTFVKGALPSPSLVGHLLRLSSQKPKQKHRRAIIEMKGSLDYSTT